LTASVDGSILDNIEILSDLLASLGTHSKDRILTPFECSTHIVRLKEETGESWEDVSKRLSLGKKKKNDFTKKTDTTMVRNFANLQSLTKKRGYAIGWGVSTPDKVAFTSAVYISKLDSENDQIRLMDTILDSIKDDSEDYITKNDVIKIVEEKRKSPETPIEGIIASVSDRKVESDTNYRIGVSLEFENNLKIKQILKTTSNLTEHLNNFVFKTNSVLKAYQNEKGTLWLVADEKTFNTFQSGWRKNNVNMTSYFNQLFEENLN
jgi:hypothetical protein